MELLPKGQKNSAEVSWEDQQKINEFSTHISKKDILTAELEKLQTEKEYIDDLSMEIELIDEDDNVDYKIGDTFVLIKQSEAMERLENQNGYLETKITELETQIEGLDSKLGALKKQLYAKFGTAINLER
ncbi:hypothetical protein HII13_004407 [Brettanomyces bruxellensis]|uniref:Prefoldin subunit 4 n=1 Tax=Dekkera bruxellensis TaxID=5007 RepID=A0A7D9GZ79_DEKBR|nr:uncharacterized protein BRETT_004156 [Brettanomyces bruxellensis]KAF6007736.1 hypothetical protein HII13_004407 [Brettanomyces bruxellensis]KAF6009625.1 hypothetical protein HII12_003171 [Brettanomyces bruxellensis]QOU18935.1 hypothetical protein BRETT_004156 [Brettanomyces bruxellensis]VUG17881.1 GIM3 [Brettanomyces bruxellensis]